MESLFKRHDAYLSKVPMEYVRDFMQHINWNSRLLVIRGPKGVGKSTLMQQYIKQHFPVIQTIFLPIPCSTWQKTSS